jgi:hypothetical protein
MPTLHQTSFKDVSLLILQLLMSQVTTGTRFSLKAFRGNVLSPMAPISLPDPIPSKVFKPLLLRARMAREVEMRRAVYFAERQKFRQSMSQTCRTALRLTSEISLVNSRRRITPVRPVPASSPYRDSFAWSTPLLTWRNAFLR